MKINNSIYQSWLNFSGFNSEEKQEISSYSEEQVAKLFVDKPFTFGTAGIRKKIGLNPQSWNIYTYRMMAYGYAKFIKTTCEKPSVLITHDNRKSGDIFTLEVAKVLFAEGITVYLSPGNQSVPTPVVSYCIKKYGFSGAINITASHNPPNYNGFKTYCFLGCQTSLEQELLIQKYATKITDIFNLKYSDNFEYKTIPANYLQDFFDEIKQKIPVLEDIKKDTKILFTSHHGTSSQIMKNFAEQLGFKNFEEFYPECNPGSVFNKDENVNPEEVESFAASQKYADKNQINYIFAHDPDSDRFGIMEKQKNGEWYLFNGNEMAILLANFLLQHEKNIEKKFIVSTYVSGNFIKKLNPNIPIYLTKTGFKNISYIVNEKEKEGGSLLIAFEEAIGALIYPINLEKDGFQQSALSMLMIEEYKKKSSNFKEELEKIYEKYGYWKGFTDYYLIESNDWRDVLSSCLKKSEMHEKINLFGYQIKDISFNSDSNSVEWIMDNDCWIKFRLSGTEPKFKIYYNLYNSDKKQLDESVDSFKNYFKNYFGF